MRQRELRDNRMPYAGVETGQERVWLGNNSRGVPVRDGDSRNESNAYGVNGEGPLKMLKNKDKPEPLHS